MMGKTAILVGDRFWQGGTNFGCQNWSGRTDFGSKNWSGEPVLAGFSAKIGPAGPILGGTDFGVTLLPVYRNSLWSSYSHYSNRDSDEHQKLEHTADYFTQSAHRAM